MAGQWKTIKEGIAGALIMAASLLTPFLNDRRRKWGATDEEAWRDLPGNDLVPHPKGEYVHAITINASAAAIWPWLVQIGAGRGGFYSYELLENMVGCDIHNVNRIVPEFQNIKVGDSLIMHPQAPVVPVTIVEPEKVLAYGGRQDEYNANVWVFTLHQEKQHTRLITRWAFDYRPRFVNRIVYNWLLEPIAAVMQRKMLLTIKQLAESQNSKQGKELEETS